MTKIAIDNEIPYYEKRGGFGFVNESCGLPSRHVDISKLFIEDHAVHIKEDDIKRFEAYKEDGMDYDLGGMIFRIDLPRGAHFFEVECVGDESTVSVTISGMHPYRIANYHHWDDAELIPIKNRARWSGNVWSYAYVNGLPYVDIEIEPLKPGIVVGLKSISIHEIEPESAEKPQIFILGDSTAKSYIFREAPMSAWGQYFYRMVDLSSVSVINYSNGGRSLKRMYIEGRFNDLLLAGKKGDIVFLQSGHNDERSRNDGIDPDGELVRFGRGSTEEMYYKFLTEWFLPAIESRGMIPVLITPVTRINGGCKDNAVFVNSFQQRKFPEVMRMAAKDTGTLLLDLNKRSVEHFNQIGAIAAKALVMALEPGESPGMSTRSFANGNIDNHPDGTHYKETLAKQYCRLVAEEIYERSREKNEIAEMLFTLLSEDVKKAVETKDFSKIFPEMCKDTMSGPNSYYRNQIEKMVQAGIFHKDEQGYFYPNEAYTAEEFIEAIAKIWKLPRDFTTFTGGDKLRRQDAAEILYDAYYKRFGTGENNKPKYMTDCGGMTIDVNDSHYDLGIPVGETVYYPLIPFESLEDVKTLPEEIYRKVKGVYQLGLMRSESGITRGSLASDKVFQPEVIITRAKAAKLLYFCFVLDKDIKTESHIV